jgi:ATP-dependent exoDNAse (exonuclease V) alpha subunit
VVRYAKGSKTLGIAPGEYARVESIDEKQNHVTVERGKGRRLQGVTLYREAERPFSEGDRIQFTSPNREQHVANRELGTIEKIDESGHLRIRLDSGRAFSIRENPHLDHGYAVTSHSSQGQTADWALRPALQLQQRIHDRLNLCAVRV